MTPASLRKTKLVLFKKLFINIHLYYLILKPGTCYQGLKQTTNLESCECY